MDTSSSTMDADFENKTFRKITRRIMPFLFIAMLAAYLNRVNVGFIQESLSTDLGFSNAAYGLGAGLFFVGYLIFEVPSNMLMHRIGARRTLRRIMILWGITSASIMLVQTEWHFYALRFLLGVFEAGFFPAVLLYLTYWFPSVRRGKAMALLITGVAVSGVVGAPMSGAILSLFDGALGMEGWQWMLLVEGLPPVILGLLVFKVLADHPDDARWLSATECRLIKQRLAQDARATPPAHASFAKALKDIRVYAFCFIYFSITGAIYLISFWLPRMLSETGDLTSMELGLLVAIPYLCAAIAMVVVGAHSDRTQERRWHLAGAGLVGVTSLIAATQVDQLLATVALFTVATSALLTMSPLFWTVPTTLLTGSAAAGGIALINSVGNLSGFVSPLVMGWISDLTGSFHPGLWFNSGLLMVGVVLLFGLTRHGLASPPAANGARIAREQEPGNPTHTGPFAATPDA